MHPPLSERFLWAFWRMNAAGLVFWLVGAALWHAGAEPLAERFLKSMASACLGALPVMAFYLIAFNVELCREHRATIRRIEQRAREAALAEEEEGWE